MMDEGLVVVGFNGSVHAFDRGAEQLLGLAPGQLRVGADLRSMLGGEILDRLWEAAPSSPSGAPLDNGELSFQIDGDWVTARATRLSAEVTAQPSLLVRFSSRAVGAGRDLAARLSRELRAPVAAIRGCSQTLLGGALEESERARRFIEMMDYNADQLELIADDLDAFAQVRPEWIRDNRRAVDVRPILGWAARAHATSVVRRGVAVRALPIGDEVIVAAVPQLFERALRGLVGELVRAARKGEEITCAAARVVDRSSDAPTVAEIAVERAGAAAAVRPDSEGDRAGSLCLETVRDVVRSHGGWLAARGDAGRLEAVRLFWPLWGKAGDESRAA